MSEIFAVVNQKGGVGKTTTSVNVSSYMANCGKSVLIVDLDPQANATVGLGVKIKEDDPALYDVIVGGDPAVSAISATSIENLDILPSTPDLAGGAVELMDQPYREYRLRRVLKMLKDRYDFIVIDCPPSLGILTINGLAAADRLLIPVQCEFYALEGLNQLLQTVDLVRKHINPRLQIMGAVLTMFDRRTALSRKVVREVRKTFPGHVFESMIPRNTELAEAPSHGQTILEYDRESRGAKAYEFLSEEVIRLYS